MDMYNTYIDLIKKRGPNAKVIIDLFHITQLLSKTGITVTKENREDINKFKNYWGFILKFRFDLDVVSWKKFKYYK